MRAWSERLCVGGRRDAGSCPAGGCGLINIEGCSATVVLQAFLVLDLSYNLLTWPLLATDKSFEADMATAHEPTPYV